MAYESVGYTFWRDANQEQLFMAIPWYPCLLFFLFFFSLFYSSCFSNAFYWSPFREAANSEKNFAFYLPYENRANRKWRIENSHKGISVFLCGEGNWKANIQSLVEQDLLDCGIVLLVYQKEITRVMHSKSPFFMNKVEILYWSLERATVVGFFRQNEKIWSQQQRGWHST